VLGGRPAVTDLVCSAARRPVRPAVPDGQDSALPQEFAQNKGSLEQLSPHIAAGDKIDVLGWYQTVRGLIANTGVPKLLEDYLKRDKYPVDRFSAKELDLVGKGKDRRAYALWYAWGGNLTATFYNRALFK